jgi:predicted RNA binding protein YcfA (HicA-like mRNA interferase family)
MHFSVDPSRQKYIVVCINSRDIIRKLKDDGWFLKRITGSHHHFMHSTKPGIVTVPHPMRDLPRGTLWSIERQAGIRLR